MIPSPPVPRKVRLADIERALSTGWRVLWGTMAVSVGYAAVFAFIGLILIGTVVVFDVTPLILPLAGGFMLVGPALLVGYFNVFKLAEVGGRPGFADLFDGFRNAAGDLWVLALICTFLFLVWITDAATIYSFMIGRTPVMLQHLLPPQADVLAFELYGSLMGSVLAFIIYAISAFAVPLLFDRRAALVSAVVASVRAVFGSFFPALLWGLLLAVAVIASILVLPLLLFVFPWLAYASYALYRETFPL
jgi:uncharacterized membrane protein